jgi:hypothetical protein
LIDEPRDSFVMSIAGPGVRVAQLVKERDVGRRDLRDRLRSFPRLAISAEGVERLEPLSSLLA